MARFYAELSRSDYPLTRAKIKAQHPNVSLPADPQAFAVGALSYVRVDPASQPSYRPLFEDLAEGFPIAAANGGYGQNWIVTPVALRDAQARVTAAIDGFCNDLMAAGYPHDFGGSLGVQTLANRDEGDRTAWLSLYVIASTLVTNGQGATALNPIITVENNLLPLTAAEVQTVLGAMQGYLSDIKTYGRTLKNTALAAPDLPSLQALDITAGWPGQGGGA